MSRAPIEFTSAGVRRKQKHEATVLISHPSPGKALCVAELVHLGQLYSHLGWRVSPSTCLRTAKAPRSTALHGFLWSLPFAISAVSFLLVSSR